MRRIRIAWVLCGALFMHTPAHAAGGFKRVVVMDFENANRDKSLDWVGVGIAETLTTELGHVPNLTLVERRRLNDALKELKFGRSEFVDPATVQKMGQMLGADGVVVGSFQKFEDNLRINARLIEVATGAVRAPAMVDGGYKNIFNLQTEIAQKLLSEMRGAALGEADRRQLEAVPARNLDAFQAFSDGAYFLRNDMAADAMAQFDRALTLDPNYTEAIFQRGLALEKLQRWDDAVGAFKRALPRSEPVRRVKWSFDVPYEGDRAKRGQIFGIDLKDLTLQEVFRREGKLRAPRQIIYTERAGTNTILHLVDLHQHASKRLQIADDKIQLNQLVAATDRMTVIQSTNVPYPQLPDKVTVYGVLADGTLKFHLDFKKPGLLDAGVVGDSFFLYSYTNQNIVVADDGTGDIKWQRNLPLDTIQPPSFATTKTYGDVIVAMSRPEKKIRAVDMLFGADIWVWDMQTDKANLVAKDGVVVCLEPDKRVAAFDLESGRTILDLPVRPWARTVGPVQVVPALIEGGVLYFPSKDDELYAVDLGLKVDASKRVLWKTPLNRRLRTFRLSGARLYIGTDNGDVLAINARSGQIEATMKLGDKNAAVDYVDDDLLIASSDDFVHGFDVRSASRKWQLRDTFVAKEPTYFKGLLIVRTGSKQLSVLDAGTGVVQWQYAGNRLPIVHLTDDSLFIAEEETVKEYGIERVVSGAVTDKEILTELAMCLIGKGSFDDASSYLNRITKDTDPDYPAARYAQARLAKARGDRRAAARELATYANLVGRRSKAAEEAIAELRRDYGLVWQADFDGQITGRLEDIDGVIVNLGARISEEPQLLGIDAASGKIAWRHAGQRFLDTAADGGRLVFVTGDSGRTTEVQLFSATVRTGDIKRVATLNAPEIFSLARVAVSGRRAFVAILLPDAGVLKGTMKLSAVDLESGNVVWEKTEPYESPHGVTAVMNLRARGDFVVVTVENMLRVFSAADGGSHAQHVEKTVIGPAAFSETAPESDVLVFVTADQSIGQYSLARKEVIARATTSGLDPAQLLCGCAIRADTLFDTDRKSVFALDLRGQTPDDRRMQWRLPAGGDRLFGRPMLSAGRLFVARDDGLALEIDPIGGKVVAEHQLLWGIDGFAIKDQIAFVTSPDGGAYALRLDR